MLNERYGTVYGEATGFVRGMQEGFVVCLASRFLLSCRVRSLKSHCDRALVAFDCLSATRTTVAATCTARVLSAPVA